MLPEPWNTLLFLVGIPAIVQILKVIRARRGVPLSRTAKQVIAFMLAAAFTGLSGGFSVLEIPALPVWGGDFVTFGTAVIEFAGAFVAVAGSAWMLIVGLYETVYDKLMNAVGFTP